MSSQCHICGPVKHECPTVICAPCALWDEQLKRSAAARDRLETLVPIADAMRALAANSLIWKPFVYIPPLGRR